MMIGAVMFLGGFCVSLLAFYGRNAPLLMLAGILFAFCWVGNERVHKAFRLIPISLLTALSIVGIRRSFQFLYSQNDVFLAIICVLMIVFLIVSMVSHAKYKQSSLLCERKNT